MKRGATLIEPPIRQPSKSSTPLCGDFRLSSVGRPVASRERRVCLIRLHADVRSGNVDDSSGAADPLGALRLRGLAIRRDCGHRAKRPRHGF